MPVDVKLMKTSENNYKSTWRERHKTERRTTAHFSGATSLHCRQGKTPRPGALLPVRSIFQNEARRLRENKIPDNLSPADPPAGNTGEFWEQQENNTWWRLRRAGGRKSAGNGGSVGEWGRRFSPVKAFNKGDRLVKAEEMTTCLGCDVSGGEAEPVSMELGKQLHRPRAQHVSPRPGDLRRAAAEQVLPVWARPRGGSGRCGPGRDELGTHAGEPAPRPSDSSVSDASGRAAIPGWFPRPRTPVGTSLCSTSRVHVWSEPFLFCATY